MLKLNLQFFGGRGASSGFTDWLANEGGTTGGTPKEMDVSQFKGWTLEQIEGRLRNLDHEELFVIDKDGSVLAAYKGGKSSVAFPQSWLSEKGITVTHGHPKGAADFGGTFSFADMRNMLQSNWAEHRATASGQGEMNYILRRGKNAKSKQFYNQINKDYQSLTNNLQKTYNDTRKDAESQGKTKKQAMHIARQKAVGELNAYYKSTAAKYGFEYVTRKKEYKYNR